VGEFYDSGWEATENYTREKLGVDETQKDGHHDDIWVTAVMMVSDPAQVRYEQRLDAGQASINGVSIESLDESIALGRALIKFRAELTANAIRRRLTRK
jgi:creatinine amidohydrolase